MPGWLNSLKDAALAGTARQFLSSRLEGYGKIEQLKIDTKERVVDLEILLEGESSSVAVTLRGYEIREVHGETQISAAVDGFSTSRLWLTKLLNAQVAGRAFLIPANYAKYLRGLIG